MNDNEKLIEEAREVVRSWDLKGSWNADSPIGMLARMSDALEAAEKAHTPTGDEQELRLEYVIDAAVPVDEFPSWRFRYSRRIADAVRAAGGVR